VLILTETLEHVVHLLPRLPGFTPVYATCEEADLRKYKSRGLIDDSFPVLDKKARKRLKNEYETGKLRHVIATGVWAVGVNFTSLGALIRADGGASEIASIQLPGRVSRIDGAGKEVGIVVDFHDNFDDGFRGKARTRHSHYQKMGWEQIVLN
jgi:hypothetical protein